MAIGNFNNNESLSSVRTKLNSTIDVANELAVVVSKMIVTVL